MQLEMVVNQGTVIVEIKPSDRLADVLRGKMGLLGTKVGCREGECGSCTVLVDGEAVVSCLYPAVKAMRRAITTIEGIGTRQHPHPLQISMAANGASQCGYCTPGFIMAALPLLESESPPSAGEIKEALKGNLCRCTGYTKIIRAIELVARGEIVPGSESENFDSD